MADDNQQTTNHELSERLIALEIRVAYQEKTIVALDDVIQEQYEIIERLKAQVTAIQSQIEAMPSGAKPGSLLDELPPHY